MQEYYVNKRAQTNGDHEVHVPTCNYFPDATRVERLADDPESLPGEPRRSQADVHAHHWLDVRLGTWDKGWD